ncbi:MAG: STAS domain-containing protein [Planctomycetota bacterium]|nr:STAS domain-containing protein [Planctomycetota bacterium]
MEIGEERQGAVTILRPQGPLLRADASGFKARVGQVLGRSLGRFVIDASLIPYVDSAGLEALLDISEDMGKSGLTLKLCAATETVREILKITELSNSFEQYDELNAAVRSFL